jgi:hypothetical protein
LFQGFVSFELSDVAQLSQWLLSSIELIFYCGSQILRSQQIKSSSTSCWKISILCKIYLELGNNFSHSDLCVTVLTVLARQNRVGVVIWVYRLLIQLQTRNFWNVLVFLSTPLLGLCNSNAILFCCPANHLVFSYVVMVT